MKLTRTLLMAALAGLCFTASAQWQWIDKDGRKVFSDRAPPADIQEKNILRRPGGPKPMPVLTENAASDADAAASAPAAVPALPVSAAKGAGQDKELEAKKKQAQEAEIAKRKAADEQVAKERAENCTRAKQAKATFDAGGRISQLNAKGENEVMDDATREREVKRIQTIIAKECK
jgi:Domain of unknown function (DUF4124)